MSSGHIGPEHRDDQELTEALSSGEWGPALAVLWDRHAGLLYSAARTVCRADDDARDAMSDALANIAQRAAEGTLQISSSFKAYASIVVRNAALDTVRRTGRVDLSDDIDLDASGNGPSFLPDPVVEDLESSYISAAFSSLPERYRQILWLTEVEGLPPRDVAEIVGLSPNNVSQIAVRARTALREGWAAAHLTHREINVGCSDFVSQLPALVSGTLRADRLGLLENHLAQCADCGRLQSELMDDTVKLRGLALPIPAAILFRKLRGGGGGTTTAATTAVTQGSSLTQTGLSWLRNSVQTVQQFTAQMSTAAVVGVSSVVAVLTVSVGTFAVVSLTNDTSNPTEAVSEAPDNDGSTTPAVGDGQTSETEDATSSNPESDTEQVADPPTDDSSNDADPDQTQPADQTETDNGSDTSGTPPASGIDLGGGWTFPVAPPSIENNQIVSLGRVLSSGGSRSWVFQGTAGTKIIATATDGGVTVTSLGQQTRLDCMPLCDIQEDGPLLVTIFAVEASLPASTQLMVSANIEELPANQVRYLDQPLPTGLVKLWRFAGQANEVVALGSDVAFYDVGEAWNLPMSFVGLWDPNGTEIPCWPDTCTLPIDGSYTICAGFTQKCGTIPGNRIPSTMNVQPSVDAQNIIALPESNWVISPGNPDFGEAVTTMVGIFTQTTPLELNTPMAVPTPTELPWQMPLLYTFDGISGEYFSFKSDGSFGFANVYGPNGWNANENYWRSLGRPIVYPANGILPQTAPYLGILRRGTQDFGTQDFTVEVSSVIGQLLLNTPIPPTYNFEIYSYQADTAQVVRLTGPATIFSANGLAMAGSGPFWLDGPETYFVHMNKYSPVVLGNVVANIAIDVPAEFNLSRSEWESRFFSFFGQQGQQLNLTIQAPPELQGLEINAQSFGVFALETSFVGASPKLSYVGNFNFGQVVLPREGEYFLAPLFPFNAPASLPETWQLTLHLYESSPASWVAAGWQHTCSVRTDATISCWGNDDFGQVSGAPTGTFTKVSAAGRYSCGVRTDATIVCWGEDGSGQVTGAPTGTFIAVDGGELEVCGLRTDATIVCWGNDTVGQVSGAPTGTFTAVSAGRNSCGVRTDATVVCWGDDFNGQVTGAPTGTFTAVESGSYFSCGLRTNATITCWGDDLFGQVSGVPTGTFAAISVGGDHACGLRTDATITCWGWNEFGQSQAPSGTFTLITAGLTHSCGLRTNATITCWGSNEFGQSQVP